LYVLVSIGVFGTLPVVDVIRFGPNATLYASGGLTRMLAEVGRFPPVFGRASGLGVHGGLIITAAIIFVVANLVDLSAIASRWPSCWNSPGRAPATAPVPRPRTRRPQSASSAPGDARRAVAGHRVAMTSPSDPTPDPAAEGAPAGEPPLPLPPDPLGASDHTTEQRRRPWGWIAVCAALALAVVGTTIWALSARSDLDHQREQTAAAQQQAEQAGNQVDKLSSQVDQLTQDVNDAIDQAGQAGAAAKDKLDGALADLKDRLGQVKPPAEGSGSPAATATPTATVAAATATATPVENATPGGP
jgi:hypothetical protein